MKDSMMILGDIWSSDITAVSVSFSQFFGENRNWKQSESCRREALYFRIWEKKGKKERESLSNTRMKGKERERERVCRNNVIETRRMRGTVVGNYFQN